MDKFIVNGGKKIHGEIHVSGSKNAALPILIASILTKETSKFSNVPNLRDIQTTISLLEEMGLKVESSETGSFSVNGSGPIKNEAPYDLVRKMRASVLVLGPLLARFREAKVSLPGGCAIGARPVDIHLSAFEKMGASINIESGYIIAKTDGLKGADINFKFPSVGATENIMMAACLADGETVINNAAREPEIIDLARCLQSMGATIEGVGESRIKIVGKPSLAGAHHKVIGDRIEAGTYLIAAAITGGNVHVKGCENEFSKSVIKKLIEMGCEINTPAEDEVILTAPAKIKPVEIETLPFPGFPTDMQAQFMALMTQADGRSLVRETIFENRFMHVPEMTRLGAKISLKGNLATVQGGPGRLIGAPLMATDLRASAGLILAALSAQGISVVNRIYHIDRGYEQIEKKLRSLGADIERVKEI